MIRHLPMSSSARGAIALCCLAAAGCAAVTRAPTEESVAAIAAVTSVPVDTPPVVAPPDTVTPPDAVTAATVTAPALDVAAPSPTPVVTAATAVTAPEAVPAASAPVASLPSVAPLDFALLGTRLRETKAIGLMTKLAVKNQVDELLDEFRAYHKRQGAAATLPELRQSYDLLVFKMLSLLQDSDPSLARDIAQSRTAIWGILADPTRFIESNLMAGVTT